MSLKFKLLLIVLAVVSLFTSCGLDLENEKLILSNPTEKAISVKIDSQEYTVEAEKTADLSLKVGIHTMALPNGETVKFKVSKYSTGGIINPTRSPHVIYTMIYAVEGASNSFKPATSEVVIDGILFDDAIQTTDDMFIDNNKYRCTYFVGEPFPEVLQLYDKNSRGNLKSKYFTVKEFMDFYIESLGEEGNELREIAGGDTQITFNTVIELPVPDFKKQDIQAHALKMVETLTSYLKADSSSEQEKLQKQYHEQTMAFVQMRISDSDDVAENQKYNDFITQAGAVMGIGIAQVD